MNALEDAVRDALSARAAAVTADPTAYDAIVARRARGRLVRGVRPIGAVAAMVSGRPREEVKSMPASEGEKVKDRPRTVAPVARPDPES